MTPVKNWAIRPYIKHFREPDEKYPKGVEARYVILDYLILCTGIRMRNFYGVERIMEDCGFNSSAVVADALGWLFDHGAIYNVPPQYRVGREAKLSKNKYVFQMTGVINLNGKWIPYLLMQPDELENMVEEWTIIGYEFPVEREILLSGYKASQSEPSQSEPSQSEDDLSILSSDLDSPNSEVISPADGEARQIPPDGGDDQLARQLVATKASMAGQSPEKRTPTINDEGVAHPLVLIVEEAAGKHCTKDNLKLIESPFTFTDEDGDVINRRSVLTLYDNVPGYSDFLAFRVKAHKEMGRGKPVNIHNLIRDLQNESRPTSGWRVWKDKNPQVTTRNTDGSQATAENHDVEVWDI